MEMDGRGVTRLEANVQGLDLHQETLLVHLLPKSFEVKTTTTTSSPTCHHSSKSSILLINRGLLSLLLLSLSIVLPPSSLTYQHLCLESMLRILKDFSKLSLGFEHKAGSSVSSLYLMSCPKQNTNPSNMLDSLVERMNSMGLCRSTSSNTTNSNVSLLSLLPPIYTLPGLL
jgi:hypothetical protein